MYLTLSGDIIPLEKEDFESEEEYQYRLYHSCTPSSTPSQGRKDTYSCDGMLFRQERGLSFDTAVSRNLRSTIKEGVFRKSLISFIRSLFSTNVEQILSMIPKNTTDSIALSRLQMLPPRSTVSDSIPYILSSVPHTRIERTLDLSLEKITSLYNVEKRHPLWIESIGDIGVQYSCIVISIGCCLFRNIEKALDNLYKVLAPGGILIVKDYDYREVVSLSLKKSQLSFVQDEQGIISAKDEYLSIAEGKDIKETITENFFSHYLNSIVLIQYTASRREVPSTLYTHFRTRTEWYNLFSSKGFKCMGIQSQGYYSMEQTCIKRGKDLIPEVNPERSFTFVWRKDGGTSLSIEESYLPIPDLYSIFPPKEGVVPALKYGYHYTKKTLQEGIPFLLAKEIASILGKQIKKELGLYIFDSGSIILALLLYTPLKNITFYSPSLEIRFCIETYFSVTGVEIPGGFVFHIGERKCIMYTNEDKFLQKDFYAFYTDVPTTSWRFLAPKKDRKEWLDRVSRYRGKIPIYSRLPPNMTLPFYSKKIIRGNNILHQF